MRKNQVTPRMIASSITLFISIVVSVSAFADWQGTLNVHAPWQADVSTGKIFAKGARVRFEVKAHGHDMIILADMKSGKSSMLMPEQKLVMDVPRSMAEKQMMTCSTEDVDACFKKKGFKPVGKETIDGHPCTILEGVEKNGDSQVQQKIWRPTDMKEVFMLKSISTMKDGKAVTTEVKDVKLGKIEDAMFQAPKDYQKMQMPDFSKMPSAPKGH